MVLKEENAVVHVWINWRCNFLLILFIWFDAMIGFDNIQTNHATAYNSTSRLAEKNNKIYTPLSDVSHSALR